MAIRNNIILSSLCHHCHKHNTAFYLSNQNVSNLGYQSSHFYQAFHTQSPCIHLLLTTNNNNWNHRDLDLYRSIFRSFYSYSAMAEEILKEYLYKNYLTMSQLNCNNSCTSTENIYFYFRSFRVVWNIFQFCSSTTNSYQTQSYYLYHR